MARNNNGSGSLCIIGLEKSETNLRLLEEAKRKFGSVFFVPIDAIAIGFTDKFSISYRASDLLKFDAVLPRIPQRFCSYAYQLLSLFPSDTFMSTKPISYLLADERFFMLTVLRKRGIPTLNLRLTRTTNAAMRIIGEKDFPMIIRSPEKKTGVMVKNQSEAKSIIDALTSLKHPILMEGRVKSMISVYVANPNVLGAVRKKTDEKDIIFAKGKYKKHKLSAEEEQLALDATKAIDTQVARVDICTDAEPRVANIDLNPGLVSASKVIGVDMPRLVMESVHENYKSHTERPMLIKFFEDAKSVVNDILKSKHLM